MSKIATDVDAPIDENAVDRLLTDLDAWMLCPDMTTAASLIEEARDAVITLRHHMHTAVFDANYQYDRRTRSEHEVERLTAVNERLQGHLVRAWQQIALGRALRIEKDVTDDEPS